MQSNHLSIADDISAVLRLVFVWDKMEIDCAKGKELCYFLIHFLRLKFKDELDSPIYQVIKINVAIRFFN